MKKILILTIAASLGFAGCTKDISRFNEETKNAANVPAETLFSNGQKEFVDIYSSTNVNRNIFRLISQYWTTTTYTDEPNYDLGTRNIPANFWTLLYRNALADLNEAHKLFDTQIADATEKKNNKAMADIMIVYGYYYLVNTFGDVPYSEALGKSTFPKYDDAKTIYYDLLTRLDADIAALDASGSSMTKADLLYGGDIAAWKKFANSLKLKMGMLIADSDPAKAKTVVESAVAGGVFTSNADNAVFHYLTSPPNNNPVWDDIIQSGRQDYIAANTLVDKLNMYNDPRKPYFITKDGSGNYSGGVPGKGNSFPAFSKPSGYLYIKTGSADDIGRVSSPNFPSTILSYAEVELFLAEAVKRSFAVGGTAAAHYEAGVTASIEEWGASGASAATYLAQPDIAYNDANWKAQIALQQWLAYYNRGLDAWTSVRRLDAPALATPLNPKSDFPTRFTYPSTEGNVNAGSYKAAVAAMGGDLVTTKLFWDKF